MPLYEYMCGAGHTFEEFHKIENRHDVICPMCGSPSRIKPSLSSFKMDIPVTFMTHDGKVIDRKPGGLSAPIGRPNGANVTMV